MIATRLCRRFINQSVLTSVRANLLRSYSAEQPRRADEALLRFITDKIRATGPITTHEFMQLASGSGAGYYVNKQQGDGKIFGAEGDFITSPELCQVFGELVAIWLYNELGNTGHRGKWQLVELGPGTGTFMKDILSVMNKFKEEENLTVHLLEISDNLIDAQEKLLCGSVSPNVAGKSYVRKSRSLFGMNIYWHKDLSDIPDEFTAFVSNEFLDALPVHQFTRDEKGWHEVYVNLNGKGKLCFMNSSGENLHTKGLMPESIRDDASRKHWEVSPQAATVVTQVTEKIVEHGGFALFIDYGHDGTRPDLSLRAYHKHKQVNPLDDPGRYDITADVNFGYLKSLIEERALVFGPIDQRLFLSQMGILTRMQYLMSQCKEKADRQALFDAYKLLMTSTAEGGMGEAFKCLSIFPKTIESIMEKRGKFPDGFRPLGWKPVTEEKPAAEQSE